MAGNINVGGTWHTSNGAQINVGGVWHTITQSFVNIAGTWHTWFQSKIIDSFARVTSGSLGTADSGQTWTNLIGSWFANGSQAQVNSYSGGYALAVVPWNANATITAESVGDGTGIVFWETDAGDWWAAATGMSDYSYQTCASYGCTGSGCCFAGCCASGCTGYYSYCSTYGCNGFGCATHGCTSTGCTGSGCTGYGCTSHSSKGACTGSGCTSSGCTSHGCTGTGCTATGCISEGCTGYTTACGSYGCTGTGCCSSGCCGYGCTSYNPPVYVWYLSLLQSVSGAVSTLMQWSWTSSSNISYINSLEVQTSGTSISVTPYSDNALTTPITTETYTASSAPTGSVGVGLIGVTGGNNPNDTVGTFTAQ